MAYTQTCQIFSAAEIESLRHGGSILRDCLRHVAGLVAPGVTTLFLDHAAEEFIRAKGGKPAFLGYNGFTGTLCTSVNDEVVHGIPKGSVILKEGDIISLDGGVIFDELYTDACVTVGVGSIASPVQKFLNDVSSTLEDVIAMVVKAGIVTGDISAFIEERIKKSGYSPVRELTGHGLGDTLHQFPDVPNVGKKGKGAVLPAGTMIAIEPIATMGKPDIFTANDNWTVLSKDGSPACHFEHSVLITETGCEVIA